MPATRLWVSREEQDEDVGGRITCDSPGCPHTAFWGAWREPEATLAFYCDGHKYLGDEVIP